jgi:hypothetical protein
MASLPSRAKWLIKPTVAVIETATSLPENNVAKDGCHIIKDENISPQL